MLPIIILKKEGLSLDYKGPLTHNTRQMYAFASLDGDPKIYDDIDEIRTWLASSLPNVELDKPLNMNGIHASCWMGGREETSESHKVNSVAFKNRQGSRMVFTPRGVAARVSFYD